MVDLLTRCATANDWPVWRLWYKYMVVSLVACLELLDLEFIVILTTLMHQSLQYVRSTLMQLDPVLSSISYVLAIVSFGLQRSALLPNALSGQTPWNAGSLVSSRGTRLIISQNRQFNHSLVGYRMESDFEVDQLVR
jgi:hypothetical protein